MVTERKETKQMQSTFEKLGGTYRQEGDYLLPNVEVPESPARWVTIWRTFDEGTTINKRTADCICISGPFLIFKCRYAYDTIGRLISLPVLLTVGYHRTTGFGIFGQVVFQFYHSKAKISRCG